MLYFYLLNILFAASVGASTFTEATCATIIHYEVVGFVDRDGGGGGGGFLVVGIGVIGVCRERA